MKTFSEATIILSGKKPSPNVDAFLDDYYKTTGDHPFNGRARIVGKAVVELSKNSDGSIHLSDLMSLEAGGGSAAIEHLIALADKHKVKLEGTAKAYNQSAKHPMNSKQLAAYYKKRGFKVHPGDEYDGYDIEYSPK